jgi:hypothetical protein
VALTDDQGNTITAEEEPVPEGTEPPKKVKINTRAAYRAMAIASERSYMNSTN